MSGNGNIINFPELATVAPIANVSKCATALERAMGRASHLPGMVTFHGPSGFGKSTAAAYAANQHRAYYVECKSTWTRKALLLSICKEMGIAPAKTLYELTEQVCEQLVLSGRPLIVDEVDYIVARNDINIIRDLHEGSNSAILLIGEERLPMKLKAWERVHGRMLGWVEAAPASLNDAEYLAALYSKDIAIAADLLAEIHKLAEGSARRICVNIDLVRDAALHQGWEEVDLECWGDRKLYTGNPPTRRV